MSEARFQTAADAFDDWRESIMTGTSPTFYKCGEGELGRLEIGPGAVVLIGGAPGGGKTALTMQLVLDALANTPALRALVANVEMSAAALLDRQLARLSGIDLNSIRYRRLGPEHGTAIEKGLDALETVADRLAFLKAPFNLDNVARSADDFGAELLTLDYIQRLGVPGEHENHRAGVGRSMDFIRQFADAGTAVIVVAALARSKDARGRSSYDGEGLSLASFRETSELEYGADDAFILAPTPARKADDDDGDDDGDTPSPVLRVTLKHLKSRHGETRDIELDFDRPHQHFFTPVEVEPERGESKKGRGKPRVKKTDGKLMQAMREAWGRSKPAPEPDDDAGEEYWQ